MSSRPIIAVAQYAPEFEAVEHNRETSARRIGDAVDHGAKIVVLPECSITGYDFADRDRLALLAEPIPGPTTKLWSEIARERDVYVIGGLAERSGESLYNSAVVADPQGAVDVYRKWHLWGIERSLYSCGSHLIGCNTPWGKFAVIICYDLWFPEMIRALALRGATLIVAPSNWGCNPRLNDPFDRYGLPLGYHMAIAAACSNELVVAVADRVGRDRHVHFLGTSCIVGPTGIPLAGPASSSEEEMLLAEWVEVDKVRDFGQSHLSSRRVDLYNDKISIASTLV